ncbi:MAG TPA: TRAP transporter small permease [Pseudolabrys sp.]|jgi:TRAP-type C4-dicarboxylate transport system permease small subunit|nr:TRAP transporter small permease [Pseudolabrys sp.]
MARLAELYGRLLDAMLVVTCVLLFAMTFLIGLDVLLRNVGLGGIPPSNELSEYALYLMTILAAPGLLRRGQHIRIDIVLRMLPPRVGWVLEWLGDIVGFICCLFFVVFALKVTWASYAGGSLSIKTLVMPEWWIFAPMPFCFLMLAVEFVFRMRLLALSERAPRDDATSAA